MIEVNKVNENYVPGNRTEFEKARLTAIVLLTMPIICAAILFVAIRQSMLALLIIGIVFTVIWVVLIVHKIIAMFRMPTYG